MPNHEISKGKIDQLLAYLPGFETPGRSFVERWGGGETLEDGAITMPYPLYVEDVAAFFGLAGQPCWSDYHYNPTVVGPMLQDDALIARATLDQVKSMLTMCVRGERFCDGYWGAVLESGRVTAILRRLAVLRGALD